MLRAWRDLFRAIKGPRLRTRRPRCEMRDATAKLAAGPSHESRLDRRWPGSVHPAAQPSLDAFRFHALSRTHEIS